MRPFKYILVFAAIALLINYISAQNQAPEEALLTAEKGLEQFKNLVTETNYKDFGFETAEEIHNATLGEPIREFMVGLDELKGYRSEDDPKILLKGGDEYTYPVTAANHVRASLTVGKKGDRWKLVSFGSPHTSKLIAKTLERRCTERLPRSSYFIVKVPALYYFFLGYRQGDRLLIIPLSDDRKLDFKTGRTIPSERAFALLSKSVSSKTGKAPILLD